MMSTRFRNGTETPPSLNTDEIAEMQKQIHEKERRLRDEERALEQRRREEESKDSVIEALRSEIESLRVSQPSTSRRDLELPITQSSNQHVWRYHDPEYRNCENISNFALKEAITSIPMFDGQSTAVHVDKHEA